MKALGSLFMPKLHRVFVAATQCARVPHIGAPVTRHLCLPLHNQSIAPQPRCFSTTRRYNEQNKHANPAPFPAETNGDRAGTKPTDPQVHPVPDTQLPSHRLSQQWTLSRRFHILMDRAMAQLALVSQRINNYTGTDYSGIESLRREIAEQEALVRARYAALQQSKLALNEAQEKRTASSTELVALLERKHSWTSPDLEKYMALMRSEHTNDKSVQVAKEGMDRAEQALEEARSRLERRERAQYHEEQIWSDTIRRNSTWVTIGLVGLNIFILLFNLVAVEPWRRKRFVLEIKSALEEKAIAPVDVMEAVETVAFPNAPITTNVDSQEAKDASQPELSEPTMFAEVNISLIPPALDERPISWRIKIKNYIKGFFSDKIVSMQMVEFTAVVIQAAAGGATVAWLLVLLMLLPG